MPVAGCLPAAEVQAPTQSLQRIPSQDAAVDAAAHTLQQGLEGLGDRGVVQGPPPAPPPHDRPPGAHLHDSQPLHLPAMCPPPSPSRSLSPWGLICC